MPETIDDVVNGERLVVKGMGGKGETYTVIRYSQFVMFPPTVGGQVSDYGQLRPADPRSREGGEGERGDGRDEGAPGEEGGQGGGAGGGEGGEDWGWGFLLGHVQELGEVVFVIKTI